MEPTHEMKNEAVAMHQEADRLDSIALQIDLIPNSEYVLVKTGEDLRPHMSGDSTAL